MKHRAPVFRKYFALAMAVLMALSLPLQAIAVEVNLNFGDVSIGAENVGHYTAPDTPVVEAHGGSVTVVQTGGETNHTVTVDTTTNPVASNTESTGSADLNANGNFRTETAGGTIMLMLSLDRIPAVLTMVWISAREQLLRLM